MQACGPLSSPDCGVKELSSNISQILGHCSSTRDTTRLKELATMFIEKAKICINIGNVLTAQDPVHSQKVGCTPSMSQAVGERNEIFAPALTPPPEAWASCFLPQTSSLTQELSPSQKESPAASDDMDASSPSGTTAVPNDVNDMVISEAGFDNDFDEVFNMDMVADFLAADEDIVSCHDQDMQIGVDCEPFAALRGSELKSSFVQENAQGDPLTSLRISTQA